MALSASRERTLVVALALLAAARVTVFAVGFPFFHPVDEHQHTGAVVRYAGAELPGPRMATLHPQVAKWATTYGTFEYLYDDPAMFPPYLQRPGEGPDSPTVREALRTYAAVKSSEFDSPPSYYAIAGAWFALGRAVGLDGLRLLVWTRCLNAVFVAALVGVAWLGLRRLWPEDAFVRLGAPLLLASFPQDSWYGVSADALAPLAGAAAFVGLAALATRRLTTRTGARLAGLAVALVFLTKYTNAVFVGLLLLAAALHLRAPPGDGDRAKRPELLLPLGLFAAVPIAVWLLRNLLVLGDLTGTARKVAHLEWSPRPLAEWASHPIFTPAGFGGWLADLSAAFWRGEYTWLGQPMSLGWLDALYGLLTAVTLAAAAFAWLRHRRAADRDTARVEALAFAAVAGAVATLGALSVRFQFADWGTPTRAEPFFHHGRLILGVLFPFAILHVRGIQTLSRMLPKHAAPPAAWLLLLAWITLYTVAETGIDTQPFHSNYNLLHSVIP